MNCLVDTGSEVTLVSLSLVKDIGVEKVEGSKYVLSSFTKDRITTMGEVMIAFDVAGIRARHKCIVVDNHMDYDVLLGMDFINAHQLNINAKDRVVSSDWGHCTFLAGEPVPVVRRIKVRSSQTVTVPPNSLMFVTGSLDTKQPVKRHVNKVLSGLFEPYGGNDELLTAEAICFSENGEVPVRVLNTTDKPITLFKRKLLGFLDPPCGKTESVSSVHIVQKMDQDAKSECPRSESGNRSDSDTGGSWTKKRLFKELELDGLDATPEELKQLKEVIWKHKDVFSRNEFDLGTCKFFKASIHLKKDAVPQYVCPIPTPYKQRDALKDHLNGLIEAGVVEEMKHGERSRWNARVFLVKKPHQPGKWRFVADFRSLNAQCLPDTYALPNINHVTDKLSGAKIFSTFDLSKSFYQVDYDKNSANLTAFTANGRKYIFKKLVMGHLSSSSQFSRMVDKLLETMPLDQIA